VQRSLQRNFVACADAFTPKGCVVTSLAMGDYFIKYQVTPEQHQVQLQHLQGVAAAPVQIRSSSQAAKDELRELLYGSPAQMAPTRASTYAPDPDEATARRASASEPPETPASRSP